MTISNPNLIMYACISRGTTILAEFNSQDADLATLAAKCLNKTPPLHTVFFHTVRKRTHAFLIHDPFVYFAIYDENLENSEALCFLNNVKKAFDKIVSGKSPEKLNSHSFQGDFNPVFHQLLAVQAVFEVPRSPREGSKHDRSGSLDSPRGKRIGSNSSSFKKKKRLSADTANEGKLLGLSMGDSGNQKAKRVWKRNVWVVLSVDLIVCCVLFGIWFWICRGFKCIAG